jgi:hypothetical protein
MMIGLHPHLRDGCWSILNAPIWRGQSRRPVEKKTAQQLEDEVAVFNLPLGMARSPQEWLAHPQRAATAKHAACRRLSAGAVPPGCGHASASASRKGWVD